MKFNELLDMITERNQKRETFFTEMSLRFDDKAMDVLSDTNRNLTFLTDLKKNGTSQKSVKIGEQVYDIYAYDGGASICMAFVNEPLVVALLEFDEVGDNTIQVSFINQFRKCKSLLSSIYKEFLLRKYKRIISDNVQTPQAYIFYRNFVIFNDGSYRVLIRDDKNNTEYLVDNVEDMDTTFGYLKEHHDKRYIIERNN